MRLLEGVTSRDYRDSRKSQRDIAVVYRLVRSPKGAGVASRLTIWSIDEVVEIDLYQSGVLSRQSLKCLPESYLASFSGKVPPGAPERLTKVC